MLRILLVLAGGAIGTLARYGLSGLTHRLYPGTFPMGTLMVNLAGALFIGLLWGLWETDNIPSGMRTFIFIGIFGGFTTFSSYALETLNLFREGQARMALINIFASNILGLILVFAGFIASRGLIKIIR